jgi:single-stranded-DNA-specific exonuclease
MGLGIECLLCDDAAAARIMALRLDALNQERRVIEAEMQEQAISDLDRLTLTEVNLPFGVCIYDEQWHQGVIGILAGRIRERLHRPVIAFAADKDGAIKGSARSVPGLHIRDSLDAVAARNPGLITRFGGHAMAAGLTISVQDFEAFSTAFDGEVRRCLSADDLNCRLLSDGELTPGEFTLDVAQQLRDAGPWGQGFPEPLFDGVFEVLSHRVLGEKHLKMTLRVPGNDGCIDAIGFNKALDYGAPERAARVRLAYRLDVNEYRGVRNVQLVVEHIAVPPR